jgi:hypothetical protein
MVAMVAMPAPAGQAAQEAQEVPAQAAREPAAQAAQEPTVYSLPNGLEVRQLRLAGTGTVTARLTLYVPGAPEGTAHLVSRALPLLGCGGTDRATFEALKDQQGVLSRTESGLGRVSWTFESLPSNAEMMIQLLADESLRPAWSRSADLPEVLARIWEEGQAQDDGEAAARAFRAAAGDPAADPPPAAPMGADEFVEAWSAAVRRPAGAILAVVGDVESVPLRRAIAQHFGPWDGVAQPRGKNTPEYPEAPETREAPARRVVVHSPAAPQVWVAWGPDRLTSKSAELVPWLLKTAPPAQGEAIRGLELDIEIDPGGRWIRAAGHGGASPDLLESRLKAMLAEPLTQARLDAALAARDEHAAADALHPARMLDRLGASATPHPPPGASATPHPPPGASATPHPPLGDSATPPLEELRAALGRCMGADNLHVLVVAPPAPAR